MRKTDRTIEERKAIKKTQAFWRYFIAQGGKGRGFEFDKTWLDFYCFLKDVGHKPSHSALERINEDQPYSKENVKWVHRVQPNGSVTLEVNGVKMTTWAASKVLGVSASALYGRIMRYGSVNASKSFGVKRRALSAVKHIPTPKITRDPKRVVVQDEYCPLKKAEKEGLLVRAGLGEPSVSFCPHNKLFNVARIVRRGERKYLDDLGSFKTLEQAQTACQFL